MNSSFKVTLLLIAIVTLLFQNEAEAQEIIPVKTGDVWSYRNESSGQTLQDNLEKAQPFRSGVGIAKKNGEWGAFDALMNELVPFEYDALELISPEVIRALESKRFSLYSLSGKTLKTNLTSAVHSEVILNAIVVSNEKREYGMMSSDGKMIIPMKYSRAPQLVNKTDLLFYKEKNGKFYQGVFNQYGEVIVPFDYVFVQYRNDGYYVGIDENREYHFHNLSGKKVYQGNTRSVNFIDSSFIIERRENEVVLNILSTGKQVVHDQTQQKDQMLFGQDSSKTTVYFPNGKSFSHKGMWQLQEIREGILMVRNRLDRHSTFGLWDEKGKVLLKANYTRILAWSKKWVVVNMVEHGYKQVLIQLKNKKVEGVYDKVELLSCDNLRVLQDGKTTILNDQLEELSEDDLNKKAVYLNLSDTDLERVRREYTYGAKRSFDETFEDDDDCGGRDFRDVRIDYVRLVKDHYGNEPLPNRLIVTYFENNRRKSVLLNFEGKVIDTEADFFKGYHMDGLLEFGENKKLDVGSIGRVGLMDRNGKIILPARYDKIPELRGDTAVVVLHGLYSLINIRTDEIILSGYHGIRSYEEYYSIDKNSKRGLADSKGKIVVPVVYDKVILGTDGLFEVERDKQKFYVDQKGNEIPRE